MDSEKSSQTRRINWLRILANTLSGAFTSVAGIVTAEAILKVNCSLKLFLTTALIVGLIQGGLAFSTELRREVEDNPHSKSRGSNLLSIFLVF